MTSPFAALGLSDEAGLCAAAIVRRDGVSGMLPGALLERLASRTGLAVLEVTHGLRELHERGFITGISKSGRPVAKVRWKGPSPAITMSDDERQWTDLLATLSDEGTHDELSGMHAALAGLSREDMVAILHGLLRMRGSNGVLDPWVWSAQHLLGSSKALGGLRPYLAALGIEVEPANSGRYYVITAGPVDPEAVLLIENPRVFSAMADSKHAKNILAVASYGYGLTMENFGLRLLADATIACPSTGERPDLHSLLRRCPWYFWGDLDQEGLRIFRTLRQQLPALKLSVAYKSMDALLDEPTQCHPYHSLFGKVGQRTAVQLEGDVEVNYLARRCRLRAVDQEAIVPMIDDIDFTAPFERRA